MEPIVIGEDPVADKIEESKWGDIADDDEEVGPTVSSNLLANVNMPVNNAGLSLRIISARICFPTGVFISFAAF
jgi:hypothetical protein